MFRVPNCLEMKMPGLYPGDAVGMVQRKLQCLLSAGLLPPGIFFPEFPTHPFGCHKRDTHESSVKWLDDVAECWGYSHTTSSANLSIALVVLIEGQLESREIVI